MKNILIQAIRAERLYFLIGQWICKKLADSHTRYLGQQLEENKEKKKKKKKKKDKCDNHWVVDPRVIFLVHCLLPFIALVP